MIKTLLRILIKLFISLVILNSSILLLTGDELDHDPMRLIEVCHVKENMEDIAYWVKGTTLQVTQAIVDSVEKYRAAKSKNEFL